MVLDPERSLSRRALVAGTLGAVVAAVASAIGRPLPVEAATDQVIYINDVNAKTVITANSLQTDGHPVSGQGLAIYGYSALGTGIAGDGPERIGVKGGSTLGTGVVGSSIYGTGIHGGSHEKIGVLGESTSGLGVRGLSRSDHGVSGESTSGNGLTGQSDTGYGVSGHSDNGRGAIFSGRHAQVNLSPADSATHPDHGMRGDLFVDAGGHLWFCKGTTHWVKLA